MRGPSSSDRSSVEGSWPERSVAGPVVVGAVVVGPVVLGATVGAAVTAESGEDPASDVLSEPEQAAVRSMPTIATTAPANERVRMPAA